MGKAKHTSGPWKIASVSMDTGAIAIGKDRIIIAEVHNGYSFMDVVMGNHPEVQWSNARLIENAPELYDAVLEGRRAIGDHNAPGDCYVTGPLTGDEYRDLVQCPACSFIAMHNALLAKIGRVS